MSKYLKYLFSLFLAFGLMANDGILDSQTNSAAYYQVSYLKTRNHFSDNDVKLYQFLQRPSSKKIVPSIIFACIRLQDVSSIHTRVLLKLQILLYQSLSSIKAQATFLNKILTSSNHYSNLYKA